jgi:hypothetical protein
MPTFPISADQLDPSALAALLAPATGDGIAIDTVRVSRLGEGQGLLGDVCLAEVDYAGPTRLPSSFVVKFPAANPASRATAQRGGLYLRELRFFTELAPGRHLSIPRCWAARFDEHTHDFVLVLERVEPLDHLDQVAGCTVDRARSTISELARLHASWWRSKHLETLVWLPTFGTPQRTANLTGIAQDGWPRLADIASDLIEPGDAAVGEALAADVPALLHTLDTLPSTLVHGDVRLDNLLFPAGQQTPVIVDWQGITRGPGMLDVGYFLTQSLTVADRRRHNTELVKHYRAELHSQGVDAPPLGDLWAAFALAARFSLIVACSVPVLGPLDHPRVALLARCMAERSLRAIRDLDNQLKNQGAAR